MGQSSTSLGKFKNREMWIDLRPTKIILGPFCRYRRIRFTSRECRFAIFVCLSVCHTPFTDSELERRR